MSLELVRQISRESPGLLPTNLGRTCFAHTMLLIGKLRAAGHDAYLICKTRGEGQYVPPDFEPREVVGFDGKKYLCTGVSHDAIWCDGLQFDTIGSANEHDRPIYRANTPEGWSFDPSDGSQIVAFPVWNAIPREHWRPNNPPLKDFAVPPPTPRPQQPPPVPQHEHPGREEMMKAGEWLDAFYRSSEGLGRSLTKDGAPDWEGIGAWLFDVYFISRVNGKTVEQAQAAVVAEIQKTEEWQRKHS